MYNSSSMNGTSAPRVHFTFKNSEIIHVCGKPLVLSVSLNVICLSFTVRPIVATHPEQQDRHERLVRWAPLRGHRGRRSSVAVCPAPAPGLGAQPAAPWSSPPPQPLKGAAAVAAPPPPGSPTGGPSCHETGDGELEVKYYEEEEEEDRVGWGGWVRVSWWLGDILKVRKYWDIMWVFSHLWHTALTLRLFYFITFIRFQQRMLTSLYSSSTVFSISILHLQHVSQVV